MIAIPDLINGLFVTFGSITGFMNCWKLHKDKQVKGIVWWFNIFYITWGCYNLYFYPHLHQWISFCGEILICLSNIIWVGLVIIYRKNIFKH